MNASEIPEIREPVPGWTAWCARARELEHETTEQPHESVEDAKRDQH